MHKNHKLEITYRGSIRGAKLDTSSEDEGKK